MSFWLFHGNLGYLHEDESGIIGNITEFGWITEKTYSKVMKISLYLSPNSQFSISKWFYYPRIFLQYFEYKELPSSKNIVAPDSMSRYANFK